MSRIWKWILGILGVLIIVGLIAGAVFMWRNHGVFAGGRAFEFSGPDRQWGGQMPGAPNGTEGYRRYHMQGWGGRMPMMGDGYGYAPHAYGPMGRGFMFFGGLFHLLVPLGVLALVAYIFYQMGKRAGAASASASLPDVESLPRRRVARS